MPADTLDFEEPIAVLLKEVDALALLPQTDAREREIESLRRRITSIRTDLYRTLTPWQRVLVAWRSSPSGCSVTSSRSTAIAGSRTTTPS